MFQSTRPRGARQYHVVPTAVPTCFNPRARVGRDTWPLKMPTPVTCFNPRARVGRDSILGAPHGAPDGFQSTRPRGARRQIRDNPISSDAVSIHAPAWGATSARVISCSPKPCFNPRARVGRDRRNLTKSVHVSRFNPRARVGRDRVIQGARGLVEGFQSTRPRGARRYIC